MILGIEELHGILYLCGIGGRLVGKSRNDYLIVRLVFHCFFVEIGRLDKSDKIISLEFQLAVFLCAGIAFICREVGHGHLDLGLILYDYLSLVGSYRPCAVLCRDAVRRDKARRRERIERLIARNRSARVCLADTDISAVAELLISMVGVQHRDSVSQLGPFRRGAALRVKLIALVDPALYRTKRCEADGDNVVIALKALVPQGLGHIGRLAVIAYDMVELKVSVQRLILQ